MKPKLINDPYRNPFHNRFHVPVHARLDEMQASTNMAWLDELKKLDHEPGDRNARHWGRALFGAFALLLVVVGSAALLSN
jgi:hypothetical protein